MNFICRTYEEGNRRAKLLHSHIFCAFNLHFAMVQKDTGKIRISRQFQWKSIFKNSRIECQQICSVDLKCMLMTMNAQYLHYRQHLHQKRHAFSKTTCRIKRSEHTEHKRKKKKKKNQNLHTKPECCE